MEGDVSLTQATGVQNILGENGGGGGQEWATVAARLLRSSVVSSGPGSGP